MNLLKELQDWYGTQIDGTWENHNGVTIATTDNPGWWVKVDLRGTGLEDKPFATFAQGEHGESYDGTDWIICHVEERIFHGSGDCHKLEYILQLFLNWTKAR